MMNQLIRLNQTSSGRPRAWWQVRGALRVALLLVTAIAITMCLDPDLRAAAHVTLVEPVLALTRAAALWEGWRPLALALAAALLSGAAWQRSRVSRVRRENRSISATA